MNESMLGKTLAIGIAIAAVVGFAFSFVAESVTHAKAAIALDVRDGESWGMLGNAYMADYFGGSREAAALRSALTAYNNAEKNLATSTGGASPDLFFNRGMVR